MGRDLRKHFINPPQGGNGRGVPTVNSMAGKGTQHEAVRDNFDEGTAAAKRNVVHAGRVGQADFRNFKSNFRPAQLPDDPSGLQVYDYERMSVEEPKAPPPPARVSATLDPPEVSGETRSDGKPNARM